MASAAQNIAILERYFSTGGEFGPLENQSGAIERAMDELLFDGGANWWPVDAATIQATRTACARAQIFEKTLDPPSLMPDLFVRPNLQQRLFDGLHKIAEGGAFGRPDPAGLTAWLSGEGPGLYCFESALSDPPRNVRGKPFELQPRVLSSMLRLLRDAALPLSWIKALGRSEVFAQLEVRAGASTWTTTERRTVLALVTQAKARIAMELAKLALGPGGIPSFPTGDGKATPTVAAPAKAWYRNGWTWLGAGAGLVAGGWSARR